MPHPLLKAEALLRSLSRNAFAGMVVTVAEYYIVVFEPVRALHLVVRRIPYALSFLQQ